MCVGGPVALLQSGAVTTAHPTSTIPPAARDLGSTFPLGPYSLSYPSVVSLCLDDPPSASHASAPLSNWRGTPQPL